MGESVVVQGSGFGPAIAKFAGCEIPDSAWGLQLGVEFAAVNAGRIFRQQPAAFPDFIVG